MFDVKSRLKALKAELGKSSIKNATATPYPPLSAAKIAALEKKHKCVLPDEVRAYYLESNGQTLSWASPLGGASAHSIVMDLKSFLTGRTPVARHGVITPDLPFYSEHLDPARKRELEAYWLFERMYADSFILIPRDARSGDVPLYLFEYPDKLTRLQLSFPEYLAQLFANKGLLNWQQQYKEKEQDAELRASFERSLTWTQALASKTSPPPAPAPSLYRQKVEELVKRVTSNRKLLLVEHVTHPAPPLNAFKKIEATFQSKLPEPMAEFYSQVNGLKLLWRTKPDVTPATSGLIDIPPLERAFGGEHFMYQVDWDDSVTYKDLWNDELAQSAPEDFRALKGKRVFDRHLGRNQLLMGLSAGGVDFFYYIDGGLSKLEAGFEDLFDLVLATGGIEYYPDLLRSTPSAEQFERELEERVRLLNPSFKRP